MDAYDQLRKQAAEKRDQAIRQARLEYRRAMRDINRLRHLIRDDGQRQQTPVERRGARLAVAPPGPYCDLTAIEAARRVLAEMGPMRLTELTLEVQRRGCRTGDDPRRVLRTISQSMAYHSNRFRRGKDGRWSMVTN